MKRATIERGGDIWPVSVIVMSAITARDGACRGGVGGGLPSFGECAVHVGSPLWTGADRTLETRSTASGTSLNFAVT